MIIGALVGFGIVFLFITGHWIIGLLSIFILAFLDNL